MVLIYHDGEIYTIDPEDIYDPFPEKPEESDTLAEITDPIMKDNIHSEKEKQHV